MVSNIRGWLERAEKSVDETIEAIVVGPHYYASWGAPQRDENTVLSREAGLAKVDQEFDSGYGGADCFPAYAWTKNWVFFVYEYDGATSLNSVPRHPVSCEPQFGGA